MRPATKTAWGTLAALSMLALAWPATADADMGTRLRLQGRLLSKAGTPVPDGAYGMTVRFYANEKDAQDKALLTYVDAGVLVAGGAFSLTMDDKGKLDAKPFLAGSAAWAGIQIGVDPELSRTPLHQVPYALRSQHALDLACSGCVGVGDVDKAVLAPYALVDKLAKVATSGAYADLSGKPTHVQLKTCPAGQVLIGYKVDGSPVCTPDKDTTYTSKQFAKSKQACKAGDVVTGFGADGQVLCAKDTNSTYGGKNFALSSQDCGGGKQVRGVDGNGKVICVADKDTNSTYNGKNFALSNKLCGSGFVSRGVDANGNQVCIKDKDTNSTYSGKNFALSNKYCGSGHVARGIDANGNIVCIKDKDTNSTYSGKNFALANQSCGSGKVLRAVDGNGKFSCVNIGYEGKIAADDFSQGEVNNLRAAKLDNGSTPWKDGNQHNHVYNVNDGWLRDNGDNSHVKLYGNKHTMVFRTDGASQYSNNGGYPFIWLYGGDHSGHRKMLLNTSGQIWTSNYGWLHDKFQAKGSYANANKSCPSGQYQRGVASNGNPICSTPSGKWPSGHYCIFRNGGSCPGGFSNDSINLELGTHGHDMCPGDQKAGDSTFVGGGYCSVRIRMCCK